jgi:hypothetical protein
MQNKENKTTESSDKTEHKIAAKKTFLKELTMTDKEDFSKERVMLSDANYKDETLNPFEPVLPK